MKSRKLTVPEIISRDIGIATQEHCSNVEQERVARSEESRLRPKNDNDDDDDDSDGDHDDDDDDDGDDDEENDDNDDYNYKKYNQ